MNQVLALGANAYMKKPVAFPALIAALERALAAG